ncbi:hypothetical protein BAUCODRAFT_29160 [Baudoinia panamericana UAMH 10762]|uniref:type I protein arginine methyltransferase n=1 Tax=Baudoinia panamericana (strain UAMH 10762) TaxID=717646 RepID=M2NNH8_BAUPA|nr:uncharacterized protein BAUCODRAFT_29160 [Baudoinia panamericana UAMH 10762]EMD00791.1 hypothetical protein BAUCODRAFT_29160 [Baudoinia panamericana UAMH 10762]
MNNSLPPGWRVSNSQGSWSAPSAPQIDRHIEDDDGDDGGLDDEALRPDSPGWEDVEDDTEPTSFKCLLCEDHFETVRQMVDHAQQNHDFDLDLIRTSNQLDFYSTIRLINYVREQVRLGANAIEYSHPAAWADEKYLQPVLEDDALLYSIDELANPENPDDPLVQQQQDDEDATAGGEGSGHKMLAERALR